MPQYQKMNQLKKIISPHFLPSVFRYVGIQNLSNLPLKIIIRNHFHIKTSHNEARFKFGFAYRYFNLNVNPPIGVAPPFSPTRTSPDRATINTLGTNYRFRLTSSGIESQLGDFWIGSSSNVLRRVFGPEGIYKPAVAVASSCPFISHTLVDLEVYVASLQRD